MKYVYPAIFYEEIEGGYTVEFPDVEGALTQGETLYDAMEMAEDSLAMAMILYEDSLAGKVNPPLKNKITKPTSIDKINPVLSEYSKAAFVTLIKADTDAYRQSL